MESTAGSAARPHRPPRGESKGSPVELRRSLGRDALHLGLTAGLGRPVRHLHPRRPAGPDDGNRGVAFRGTTAAGMGVLECHGPPGCSRVYSRVDPNPARSGPIAPVSPSTSTSTSTSLRIACFRSGERSVPLPVRSGPRQGPSSPLAPAPPGDRGPNRPGDPGDYNHRVLGRQERMKPSAKYSPLTDAACGLGGGGK